MKQQHLSAANRSAEIQTKNMLIELDPYRKEIAKLMCFSKPNALFNVRTGEIIVGHTFSPEHQKIVDLLNQRMDEIHEKYKLIIKDIGVTYGIVDPEEQV